MKGRDFSKSYYFEIAWEVVNKVGGIYTVIRSKAASMVVDYGRSYCLLGTYNPKFADTDVEIIDLKSGTIADTIRSMRESGIKVYYGRWLIDGYPSVILFDIDSAYSNIDGWRHELYERTGISIPTFDKEGSDVLVFGGVVSWFLGEFKKRLHYKQVVLAHFHEWLSSVGLILARKRNIGIATVFTTHATLMGRHLSAANADLYHNLHGFNLDKESGDRKIYHKFCIERAATHLAHSFTTVSKITGEESEAILCRKPDVITPNGLNVVKYTALHEFQNLHALSKEKINRFVMGHFSGNFDFDLDKTLYFFSAGRYEFTNKGVDLFLESLANLNGHLKWINSEMTVVVFLIFPAQTNNYNVETLKGQALNKQLMDTVNEIKNNIGNKLLDAISRGNMPDVSKILSHDDKMKIKKYLISSKRSGWAPICTHNACNDSADPILSTLRRLNLLNAPTDRVKVIFHPEFLNSSNPLFPIEYEDFVRGCHLGVFCSYYEPWGYTPAECTVMGIPSVTSNLSGFGEFMQDHLVDPENFGIYIVDRKYKSCKESIDQLCTFMINFTSQNRKQRILQRNRTERLSDILDWKLLRKYYFKAYRKAIRAAFPSKMSQLDNDDNALDIEISNQLKRTLSITTINDIQLDDGYDTDYTTDYSEF